VEDRSSTVKTVTYPLSPARSTRFMAQPMTYIFCESRSVNDNEVYIAGDKLLPVEQIQVLSYEGTRYHSIPTTRSHHVDSLSRNPRRCICFEELGDSRSFTEKVRKEAGTAQRDESWSAWRLLWARLALGCLVERLFSIPQRFAIDKTQQVKRRRKR